jgi:AcrR family transcriptional regulator
MPLTALGIIGLVIALVATEMLREAVRREYGSWAPELARVLVRLAGFIHRSRAAEWRSDVLYLQAEGSSGLWEASCHLVAAPGLLARELAGRRNSPAGEGHAVDWAAVSHDGEFRGLAVSGAETMAIVTTPAYYKQHLKKPPPGCDVYLASPGAFAVLRRLADSVDPDRVGEHRHRSLYFVFWDGWKVTSSCECCSGGRLR